MDLKALHAKFRDDDSPSVEGQIRWLQKQGFAQHHIDQAIIGMYTDIEQEVLTFKSGHEMDQKLLERAKQIRTNELATYVGHLERFESDLKAKWEKERLAKEAANNAKSWFERIFK